MLIYEAQARRGLAVVSYAPVLGSGRPLKNGTGSEQHPRIAERNPRREVPVPFLQHAAGPEAAGDRPAATPEGQIHSIEPGMPLAEAIALHQWASLRRSSKRGGRSASRARSVHLEAHDPLADRLALEQLAQWCHQFSPIVGLEEAERPESLLLDIGKVSQRFGGERALARQLAARLPSAGFTPGWRWPIAWEPLGDWPITDD